MSAAALCVAAAVSGCSASPAHDPPAKPTAPANHATPAADTFTVAGNNPVPPNGSQDTRAQTPGTPCDQATFRADESVGATVSHGFTLTGFPVAGQLLRHFLAGTGTAVSYPAGSAISRQALASAPFRALNARIQAAVGRQLAAGSTAVRLPAAQLPPLAFETASSDLYWGFRGTQGLSVTGTGRHTGGRFTGTLTYVIRDSYGFPAGDTLSGFGPPMRYLQTVCGAPQHPGGAHWFPDTITVTVPFSRPS
jgi:hypothetical protein